MIVPVVALGLATLLLPSQAEACSCGAPPDPAIAADAAAAVFVGQVVSAVRTEGDTQLPSAEVVYQFEVKSSYKGAQGRVSVRTNASSAACGRTFVDGETYLVYASGSKEGLRDSACSRTRVIANATEDLAVLDADDTSRPVNGTVNGASVGPMREPGTVVSQCDTILEGTLTPPEFVSIVKHHGANAFFCAHQLELTGTVELDLPNVRLVALELGGIEIEGNLLIGQPTVLMGVNVKGATVLSERAAGSVLVANTFSGPMLSGTSQFLAVGNTCGTACRAPGGDVEMTLYVPRGAGGIIREVPGSRISKVPAGSEGLLQGWVSQEVVLSPYRPRLLDEPSAAKMTLSDLTADWPPPAPVINGSDDASVAWIPVYGSGLKESGESIGVFVPLQTGSFWQPTGGFVFVP